MDRWTMEQLEATDDLDFAVCILNERRNRLNPYSPLAMKLSNAASAISAIKEEKDRYLRRISPAPGRGLEAPAGGETETDETEVGGDEQ